MSRCKELFAEAAGLMPAERAAMLDRACADDPALRTEIERLLAAFDGAGDFLEASAIERSALTRWLDRAGTRIGNYTIREQLGEGGMGIVWKAEQSEPVRREVALKLLRPGTESRQVLARFETERRALERMEHPNIARVLDAGTTESGRPYVVMELVRGVSITTFCDSRRMTVPDRLSLFLPVCRAVQHAHAKGIIHRDLKPSNILVADDGRIVTPKVIDFSIARRVDRSKDETNHTRHLLMLGTPSYVSPEQATGSLDIDTRADIYSLGAVLYELLCGMPPFDAGELSRLTTDEFLRRLQQDDPVRPSRRLIARSDSDALAEARRSTPAALRRLIGGDLDRIVMKALDKEPLRRYETAAALADDLERFLRHEPVTAVRPSPRYLAGKFARRHRVGLLASGLVSLSILAGAAVSTWQAVRAASSEGRYRREAYLSDLNLADEVMRNDDPRWMKDLLDRHIPVNGHGDLRGFGWNYLYRHCTSPGRLIDTFPGAVYITATSPDGELLAAGGADGTARLYDTQTWKRVRVIHCDQGEVNGIAFSPDGEQIATAGDDGNVRLWKTATGEAGRTIPVFDRPAFQVAFTEIDGTLLLAVCGRDSAIKLIDVRTGTLRQELIAPDAEVEAIAVFDNHRLAAASTDGVPRIWNMRTGELETAWPRQGSSRLISVAFSRDGQRAAFGTHDRYYLICETHSRQPPQAHEINSRGQGDGAMAQSLAFDPRGETLFIADRGSNVRVYPVALDDAQAAIADSRYPRWATQGNRIYSLTLFNEGRQVVTGCDAGSLTLWYPFADPDARTLLTPTLTKVVDFAVGPEGVVAVAGEHVIDLYQIDEGFRQRITKQADREFTTVKLSRDGQTVLAGTDNGRVTVWQMSGTGVTQRWTDQADEKMSVNDVTVSADGRYVAATYNPESENPRELRLFNAATGERLNRMTVPSATVAKFSPDSTLLAVDRDSDVLLVEIPSLKIRHEMHGHAQSVDALAFRPDGRMLASGGNDRYLYLWNVESGTLAEEWPVQGTGIRSLDFDPDGVMVLCAGLDETPRIIDIRTGREVLRFPRLPPEHWPMRFLPDGQQILSRRAQGGLTIFDGRPVDLSQIPNAGPSR